MRECHTSAGAGARALVQAGVGQPTPAIFGLLFYNLPAWLRACVRLPRGRLCVRLPAFFGCGCRLACLHPHPRGRRRRNARTPNGRMGSQNRRRMGFLGRRWNARMPNGFDSAIEAIRSQKMECANAEWQNRRRNRRRAEGSHGGCEIQRRNAAMVAAKSSVGKRAHGAARLWVGRGIDPVRSQSMLRSHG